MGSIPPGKESVDREVYTIEEKAEDDLGFDQVGCGAAAREGIGEELQGAPRRMPYQNERTILESIILLAVQAEAQEIQWQVYQSTKATMQNGVDALGSSRAKSGRCQKP